MVKLGRLINVLLDEQKAEGNPDYALLKRVFADQFKVVETKKKDDGNDSDKTTITTTTEITAKENEEINAKSVQTPHDEESEYRNKAGNKVRGYSENITETCDEEGLNLIVDVQTSGAGTADNTYLKPALEAAQEIVTEKIEESYEDGAFNSEGNNEYCDGENITLILTGMQGKPSRYDLAYDDEGELIVTDRETNTVLEATPVKSRKPDAKKKWTVKDGQKTRTFSEDDVERSLLRKKIEAIPQEKRNIRNGVEGTIMQLGYHFRADKSKFRGKMKHHIWALTRCMWINYRRIMSYFADQGEETTGLASVMG